MHIFSLSWKRLLGLALIFLIFAAQAGGLRAQTQPTEPGAALEGSTWGGRWDDTWLVFITLEGTDGQGNLRLRYQHEENVGDELHDSSFIYVPMEAGYFGASRGGSPGPYTLYFRLDPAKHTGILYGNFKLPRMANLVRIDHPPEELTADVLEANGWKAGTGPAKEALRQILGKEADLLGSPLEKKRSVSGVEHVVADARLLQTALERWATENGRKATDAVTWPDLKPYIHPDHPLAQLEGADLYGRPFTLTTVGKGVKVHRETYETLRESAKTEAWEGFAP